MVLGERRSDCYDGDFLALDGDQGRKLVSSSKDRYLEAVLFPSFI